MSKWRPYVSIVLLVYKYDTQMAISELVEYMCSYYTV